MASMPHAGSVELQRAADPVGRGNLPPGDLGSGRQGEQGWSGPDEENISSSNRDRLGPGCDRVHDHRFTSQVAPRSDTRWATSRTRRSRAVATEVTRSARPGSSDPAGGTREARIGVKVDRCMK